MNIAVEIGSYGVRAAVQHEGKIELAHLGDSLSPYLIPPQAFVTKKGDLLVGQLAELSAQGDCILLDELDEMMPTDAEVVEVYTELFAFIKRRISTLYKQPISSVTMVVPPYYQSVDPRKNNIREAWKRNEITAVGFISSDVSACYKCLNLSPEECALVFDIGHNGTILSIVKRNENQFQTARCRYISGIGGRAFRNLIYSEIEKQSQLQDDLAMQFYQVQNIDKISHAIMEALSSQESVVADIPFTEAYRYSISRQSFQEMIAKPLEKVLSESLVCVKDAGECIDKIQQIVLTGGCSQIPYIRQLLGSFFNTGNAVGKKIIVPANSESAMFNACRGAFIIQSKTTSTLKF